MKKRILSIVLAICMVLTLVPITAYAEPTQEVYVIAGNAELCGITWEGNPTNSPGNVMTDNGDGTYTKVYTNVAVMDGYQFKVVKNSTNGQTWYGIDGGDNNFTFNVVSVCDVTITLDSATLEITLAGEGVELVSGLNIESMRAVGNGDGNWLNGLAWEPAADENLMTEVSSGVYEITYTDLDAFDNYQFKFAANGSWADNWGGVYTGSGVESDAVYNSSDNITVSVPYELADVTIRLDLTNFEFATKTGAKFTVTVTNKAKSDFTYTVSDDNKVTITGYTGSATDVVIPDTIDGKPVKAIGAYAFKDKAITSVTIPNSVTSIGTEAFYSCLSLTGIELPGSVTSIGNAAFAFCGLASVTLRHGVTSIGTNAFNNCHRLTSIEIPGSVTSIGTNAFFECYGLESIFLPKHLEATYADIPNTTSQVRYRLDETAGEVTITEIALGIDKTGVAIPATICGYPVVAVADSEQSKVGSHTCVGGQATCQNKAICRICKQEYGEKKSDNHTGKLVWATTETQHKKYWNCCNAVVVDYEDHTWNNGVCSVCNYTCTHEDINRDHNCDYCHEQITTCIDDDKDHLCDTCGLTLSDHTGGTATCVAKAICEYCTKEYGELDSTNHNLENIPAKDATVTETGYKEYWHCKDCAKYFADEKGTNEIKLDDTVIANLPPEIIEGKGQSITAGEKKELTFKSNAAYSDFIRVELDGKNLDAKNYTVKEGSTIVTLKADYVATVSAGEHTIGIVSESGTATTTFIVNAKAVVDNDTKSPQTGDNSHMALWIALLFVSGAGAIGTTVYGKKKRAK